jgi:hypothetical protein
MNDEKSIPELLEDLGSVYTQITTLLEDGHEREWTPGLLKSGTAPVHAHDPTGEIAVDPRRLRLRLAVMEAERELRATLDNLSKSRRHLADALTAWSGEAPED